jgi:hypothetical protein
MRAAAVIMIVLGLIIAFVGWQGYTTREKVVDIGPIDVTHEETRTSNVPVIGGFVLAGAGLVVLLMAGNRRGAVV